MLLIQVLLNMHLSARMAIERQYCHQKEPLRFFSPLTFMEFVHVFRIISAYIVKMELVGVTNANPEITLKWPNDTRKYVLWLATRLG